MIDANQLIEFFEAEYCQDEEANEIKKAISDELKSFAENNSISPKSIKTAFNLYKKFRSGKSTQEDCSDYSEMSGIIEEYFAKNVEDF